MSYWGEIRKLVAEARKRVSLHPASDERSEALKELADIEAKTLSSEKEERALLIRLSIRLHQGGRHQQKPG